MGSLALVDIGLQELSDLDRRRTRLFEMFGLVIRSLSDTLALPLVSRALVIPRAIISMTQQLPGLLDKLTWIVASIPLHPWLCDSASKKKCCHILSDGVPDFVKELKK